mmetsp:Transcript_46791/g.111400  ORF Transcript_46791/g.111400 Transcript_46791/m.111400 type:complete len:148 (-) Transcript_46791:128-571(-)
MAVGVILALVMFLGNVGLLGILTYKVLKYAELEEDYMNPTDFARGMNNVFPFELGLQVSLTVLSIFSIFSGYSMLRMVIVIMNIAYLGYHAHLYLGGKWRVDAAAVWNPKFKETSKRTILVSLVFCGLCFFFYLYNLVHALTYYKKR